MQRKVRRYSVRARKFDQQVAELWKSYGQACEEMGEAKGNLRLALMRERDVTRQRDLLLAEHAALLAALGLAPGPEGYGPLAITITAAALAMIDDPRATIPWKTVVLSELRHRFRSEMQIIFEGAVVPLVAEAGSIAELDRLLGDQGRINIALGREIVRAGGGE